ncbi:MAG: TSUP family transporter, partial [Rhizobiaceae bacterium]
MNLTPEVILGLLVLAAFVAGFIDAIAGGGGLITVPALILAGLPPVVALGTNKLQSIFGSASATIAYAAKGHIDIRKQLWPFVISASGSALGAWVATQVSSDALRAFLPYLMIAIAFYFLFKPNMSDEDRLARMTPLVFTATIIPAIGFYDGIFGPGTGSFFMLGFVALAGYGLLKATAHTKLLNFASNFGAFIVFASWGVIDWKIGLLMGAAQFVGGRTGAQFAMKNGSKIIK